ncbi:MAG: hypothetical protein IE933_00895 [Sphingomonadales bacterium]|nr:hypothetical protein [Sphingomonadales bacterium]MBD3772721.1 hypothetical protein [Paracoccaceae bacterium]
MKIVFSRKGFDSAAGGGASPIVGGRPVSLPIPAGVASRTSYGDLGLGELAGQASRGRHGPGDLCHHDPMFLPDGRCVFGQCGAAQTHLINRGVGVGDVFLFFGLFREEETGEPHHRIFGWLEVERCVTLSGASAETLAPYAALGHPHALAPHGTNDMLWCGPGATAPRASSPLRLTVAGGPPSLWHRPPWLKRGGLSYHDRADRWLRGGRLRAVARGQEFVADIGTRAEPRRWLHSVLAEMRA